MAEEKIQVPKDLLDKVFFYWLKYGRDSQEFHFSMVGLYNSLEDGHRYDIASRVVDSLQERRGL